MEKDNSIKCIKWNNFLGKKIRIWYYDGSKVVSRDLILTGLDTNTLFFKNDSGVLLGISLDKYIRHEVLENE